jgi:hypothetical protein
MFVVGLIIALFVVGEARRNFVPDVLGSLKNSNTIFPKEWTSITVSGRQLSTNPTGYFISTRYAGSTTCSGLADSISGIGMGVCMTSGATSVAYDWGKTSTTYVMKLYSTPDCTGAATSYEVPLMTTCNSDGTNGYRYSLANTTTPWTEYQPGVIYE